MSEQTKERTAEDDEHCTCVDGHEPHTCPFALEIHDNDRECACCPNCTYECAQDI